MASTSETGHAKNIANFKKLNDINIGFGASYSPTNNDIKSATMVAQHTVADGLQQDVADNFGLFVPVRNARMDLFKTAPAVARKIRSAAKTSGIGAAFVKNVNTVVEKILGERLSKPTPTATDPAGTSASQQSYDKIVDHFESLASILAGQPTYSPDTVALKTPGVQAFAASLDTANNNVKSAIVPYNNAIIARNRELYTKGGKGLANRGQLSKEYVKEKFGPSSPEYKLVSKIKFTYAINIPG